MTEIINQGNVNARCKSCSYFCYVCKDRPGATACANPGTWKAEIHCKGCGEPIRPTDMECPQCQGMKGQLVRFAIYPGSKEFECGFWSDKPLLPDCSQEIEGKAVFIVGKGPTTKHMPDLMKRHAEAEIWTLNEDRHFQATRHFEVHDVNEYCDMSDIEALAEQGKIVYINEKNFPFDHILRPDKLHSTICYMLAMADIENFTHIYTPGVDFLGKREEEWEARGAEYRVGVLEGKGCYVWLSYMSNMMKPFYYGLGGEGKRDVPWWELEKDNEAT